MSFLLNRQAPSYYWFKQVFAHQTCISSPLEQCWSWAADSHPEPVFVCSSSKLTVQIKEDSSNILLFSFVLSERHKRPGKQLLRTARKPLVKRSSPFIWGWFCTRSRHFLPLISSKHKERKMQGNSPLHSLVVNWCMRQRKARDFLSDLVFLQDVRFSEETFFMPVSTGSSLGKAFPAGDRLSSTSSRQLTHSSYKLQQAGLETSFCVSCSYMADGPQGHCKLKDHISCWQFSNFFLDQPKHIAN